MRLRFSIRWLVILVAVAALLIFGVQMRRTRNDRLQKAREFNEQRRGLILMIARLENSATSIRAAMSNQPDPVQQMNGIVLGDLERDLSMDRIREDYAHRMAAWYERRASHPWERLGQEPPMPPEMGH